MNNYNNKAMENKNCRAFCKLINIMEKLRGPEGCPWDRKQTEKSLIKYLSEETYEVVDAIEEENYEKLKEELGDLLLQVVFLSQIAKEKGEFTAQEVADFVSEKLISRHPHVFGNEKYETAEEVLKHWDSFKKKEKKGLLDGIPKFAPALLEAFLIGERVSRVGFDWKSSEGALEKIDEETAELKNAIEKGKGIDEELGDILFSVVNAARLLGVNPEEALKLTTKKFRNRFKKIEEEAEKEGKALKDISPKEMNKIWEKTKPSEP